MDSLIIKYSCLALLGFLLGMILTIGVRSFAVKYNIVNQPNPIVPQHQKPIAYLGGVGIFLGIGIAVLFSFFWVLYAKVFTQIALFSFSYLILGLIDDLKELKPMVKLSWQVLLAICAVNFGICYAFFDVFLIDQFFSVFWIVFVINAFNFTDVCDGLVSGIAIASFVLIGLLFPEVFVPCLIFGSVCAGFLVFNFPPASIFLGDAGSHFIGFLVASLLLISGENKNDFLHITQMILLTGLVAFEAVFITTIRIQKGLPWWKGSPDHFSLRLQKAGFSKAQTNFIAVGIYTTLGVAAYALGKVEWLGQISIIVLLLFGLGSFWRYLLPWNV